MQVTFRTACLGLVLAGAAPFALAGGADQLTIENPYVRAVPPGQPASAAFARITNRDRQAHALVGAKSPVAKAVELHTHVMEDGVARMRQIERVELPAGATVELKPGGLHIMLIGLESPLVLEQQVPLTLRLEDGSEAQIQAPVRPIQPMPAGHQH